MFELRYPSCGTAWQWQKEVVQNLTYKAMTTVLHEMKLPCCPMMKKRASTVWSHQIRKSVDGDC